MSSKLFDQDHRTIGRGPLAEDLKRFVFRVVVALQRGFFRREFNDRIHGSGRAFQGVGGGIRGQRFGAILFQELGYLWRIVLEVRVDNVIAVDVVDGHSVTFIVDVCFSFGA